jgi:hypothetical protein
MGLKKGAWLTVWEIKERKDKYTEVRGSTSRKNDNGEYDTDFSGFIRFVGDAHKKATDLKAKDRIQIEAFEVTNRYNKEKNITYNNFIVYQYNKSDEVKSGATSTPKDAEPQNTKVPVKDEAEKFFENIEDDEELPF